ncbi:MAG: hypothetical protein IJX81_02750 [Clostridia bacterium]|nr:hypothetical protein [Clostridia bacterium]
MKGSLKGAAKAAKLRMKNGFWARCKEEKEEKMKLALENGANELEAERYFKKGVEKKIRGEEQDEFYERVKEMLLSEGEVSDAIGRLTDHEVYDKLTYEEKQRYTLDLSERYLRALRRFKKECEFEGF